MRKLVHPTIAYLFLFTAVATILYWTLVASGLLGAPNITSWLKKFPYVSPLADIWMGGTSLLFFFFWRKNLKFCLVWGIAGSSAMIFVSLTAFTFRIYNPVGTLEFAELIEVIVPAYLLVFGIASFWFLAMNPQFLDE